MVVKDLLSKIRQFFKKHKEDRQRKRDNGHELEYYEMGAGYMAHCTRCNKASSFHPAFSKWWEEEECPE